MSLGFRTRKHGTARQIGQKFPVLEKKKLPQKIAVKKYPTSWPTLHNNDSGISNVTYIPAGDNSDGFISFTAFDGKKLSAAIRLVDKEKMVGQWSIDSPAVVFLDKKIGAGWIKSLAEHELMERHLDRDYNIKWDPYAHAISEELEHREFMKSRPESEWQKYSAQVKEVSKWNQQGGKIGRISALKQGFALLAQKRRQLGIG